MLITITTLATGSLTALGLVSVLVLLLRFTVMPILERDVGCLTCFELLTVGSCIILPLACLTLCMGLLTAGQLAMMLPL